MSLLKQPGWLRALEIATGLSSIVLGVLVLIFPGWGISTLVILLSFGIFFSAIRSISLVGLSDLSKGLRAISVIAGITSLIFAVLVLVFPGLAILTLLIIVSIGLLVYGVGRIFVAYTLKTMANWIKGVMVAVGIVDVILSFVVFVLPGLTVLTLAVILALALLISGAEMIVSGAVGRTWLSDLVETAKDELDVK
ncbi:MAG TPA: DUF308 domain-containing protein [Candidatus Nanoarchaeia archaeon]|nr:DUF308 domain-containing protein [Candidatus Nanoarchaeia archaeon]